MERFKVNVFPSLPQTAVSCPTFVSSLAAVATLSPAIFEVTSAPSNVASTTPNFGPEPVVDELPPWLPSRSFIVLNSVVLEILVSSS